MKEEKQNKKEIGHIEYTVYDDFTINANGEMSTGIAAWALGVLINEIIIKKENSLNEAYKCIKDFSGGLQIDFLQAGWVKLEKEAPVKYEDMNTLSRLCLFTLKENNNKVHFGSYNKERDDFYEYRTDTFYKSQDVNYWMGIPHPPIENNNKGENNI